MDIMIEPNEAAVVKSAIDIRIREIHAELVRTDDRAFRAGLRSDLEVLERFERRLAQAMTARAFAPHM